MALMVVVAFGMFVTNITYAVAVDGIEDGEGQQNGKEQKEKNSDNAGKGGQGQTRRRAEEKADKIRQEWKQLIYFSHDSNNDFRGFLDDDNF
jgi:hypothetical protein